MDDSTNRREVRQGRRAAGQAQGTENQPDGMIASGTLDLSNVGNHAVPSDEGPPRPSRRQGGWADDSSSSKNKRGKSNEETVVETGQAIGADQGRPADDDEEIPVIPDLDEVQEEDMATQIAAPPSVQVNRVATYRELDTDFQRHAAFSTLDGDIDLKLLTNVLSSEAEVYEDDRSWEWDKLFTEVASELQGEWDKNKIGEKEQESEE